MKAYFSPRQAAHRPERSFYNGAFIPPQETAARTERLTAALIDAGADVLAPDDHGLAPILAVHDADYVAWLREAHRRWREAGFAHDVMPNVFPHDRASVSRDLIEKGKVNAQAGLYLGDLSCPVAEGTYEAAYWSAQAAVSAAAAVLEGKGHAFALSRPPGHHAYRDRANGFCYFNNAAIAAETLLKGFKRVAVIDFDMHHGDGTQSIFVERPEVFFGSVHADPAGCYPYFSGFAHERGKGAGLDTTLNIALEAGANDAAFAAANTVLANALCAFGAEALVLSAGWDAHGCDPLSPFKVTDDGFRAIGGLFAAMNLPTVIVQEGGYNLDSIGTSLAAFFSGFERER